MTAPRPTIAAIEAHYLPLIAAARTGAEERRDEAWLDVPHEICGVPVRAMTLADYLALHCSGNAHVAELAEPAEADELRLFWGTHSAALLWRLSPGYKPDPSARTAFIRENVETLDVPAARYGIALFLRETFADRPVPIVVEGAEVAAPVTVPASFAACWIHDFATVYGWQPETTLALPLARIFQLRQLIRIDTHLRHKGQLPPAADEADRLAAQAFAEIAALSE